MFIKSLILFACSTLLLATLFNIANAEEGVCKRYNNNGEQINSTPIAVTNDACGAALKTSSCCNDTEIAEIEGHHYEFIQNILNIQNNETSTTCAGYIKDIGCSICYVQYQKDIDNENHIKICKSFCEKVNTICNSSFTIYCNGLPETNCFTDSPIIAQSSSDFAILKVSAFVMTLNIIFLGIFAL